MIGLGTQNQPIYRFILRLCMTLKKAQTFIGKLVKAEINYGYYKRGDIGIIIGTTQGSENIFLEFL